MPPIPPITDTDREIFLEKLREVAAAQNGLVLSDWETNFLDSFIRCYRPCVWFTPGRRAACDNLRKKYGHEREINMPVPSDNVAPAKLPDADPSACEYWIRDEDRRQVRCNLPAEYRGIHGMKYCRDHAEQATKDMKRAGKTIRLEPIK